MLIFALLVSLALSILAALFVFEKLNTMKKETHAQEESAKQLLIKSLQDINNKLKQQVNETATLNRLMTEKAKLEEQLSALTRTDKSKN